MNRILQKLQWKSLWRSQRIGTGIATRILMGFLVLYFGAIFFVLGFFFEEMTENLTADVDPIQLVHQYIFYYLLADIIIRVIFQVVTDVNYRQLCLLPIKRASIIHHVLNGTLISIYNLLPLFFLIPFILSTLSPIYGIWLSIAWGIALFSCLLFNNFLALQIKHFVAGNPIRYIIPIAVCATLFIVDSQGWLPITKYIHAWMIWGLSYGISFLLFPAIAILMYRLVFRRMLGQAYLSENSATTSSRLEKLNFSGLNKGGFFAMVAQLNLQLMFRNKRIRTQVIFSALFLFYGLYLYQTDAYGPVFLLFWGLYMTGVIVLSFTQYLWSYQGSYIELLFTLPIPMTKYIESQYNFLILACLATTIPSFLYYFISPDVIKINGAAFLFNIGINIPVLLIASAYNKKKLEINTAGTFNMQGVNGMQFLFVFIVLLSPVFIYLPFSIFNRQDLGLLVLSCIGLFGLLLRPFVIKGVAELIREKKYVLTENYRMNT